MARKKVLMVASVASMIGQFNMENIRLLQELGYEVYVACNFIEGSTWKKENSDNLKKKLHEMGVETYQIDFSRSPLHIGEHKKAYNQLLDVMTKNNYLFAHCHSPIGGVITRMVCKKLGMKCLYTAHGFHFYTGAPLKNWLLFYPIEKYYSKYTDTLITINQEDYNRAKSKFKSKNLEYVPGIGVDACKSELSNDEKQKIRKSLGVKPGQLMMMSVGEVSERKNHAIVIEALHKMNNKNIQYFICGKGKLQDYLQDKIKEYNLEDNVHLLGFRSDIAQLNQAADMFIFPSLQEGLPVALMEAMANKNLALCSDIRGNTDLINRKEYLFNPKDADSVVKSIEYAINNPKKADDIRVNYENIINKFSTKVVDEKMREIYKSYKKVE